MSGYGPPPCTDHAIERLRERVGVELPTHVWREIVTHALAGDYEEYDAGLASAGGTRAYWVPMGADAKNVVYVPMVINTKYKRVVTVLSLPEGSS